MGWGDIATIMGAVFVGIVAMLAVVVHLERWLSGSEQSLPAASHRLSRMRRVGRARAAGRASRTRPASDPHPLDGLDRLGGMSAVAGGRRRRFARPRLTRRRPR
jgi:hypothetical protein